MRSTKRWYRRIGLTITAAMMLALVVTTHAYAGEVDQILIDQPVDVEFTVPTISVILPDVDEGGTVCQYDLSGSGRVTRYTGSNVVRESGSAEGSTNCSKNVKTTLSITDSSPGATAYSTSCQDSGFKGSSCSTSQTVSYFSSSGVLTRPISTVGFRYRLLTGNKERICFDYEVTLVGGIAAAQGAGPCE